MTIALQLVRWRRVLVLCAATVLLHYLAAGWVDGGGAPLRAVAEKPPMLIVAELRPAAPPRYLAEAGAAVQARQVQSVNNTAPTLALAPAAVAATQGYLAEPPPAAELTFDLVRAAGGEEAGAGQAVLDWAPQGAAYRLQYTAELSLPAPERLVEMVSTGRLGPAGVVPRTTMEQRRSRARTATHFDERGNITFSATQRAVPMLQGAQDKATWPMQLSAIARSGSGQLASGVAFLVGEEKDAGQYRFVVLGQEQIDTGMGQLATWRLARVVQPGSYNARLDIWLAPGHEWYPVQLRSTEANGTVTTQTIRKIVVKDAGN